MGALSSASDLYKSLELWDEAVEYHRAAGRGNNVECIVYRSARSLSTSEHVRVGRVYLGSPPGEAQANTLGGIPPSPVQRY